MNFFRIIWDVSGGLLEVLRSNFCQTFENFSMTKKVSGRVQEGPRSPPDPIKKYVFSGNSLFVLKYFLLPIVLPIVLPFVLPMHSAWNH